MGRLKREGEDDGWSVALVRSGCVGGHGHVGGGSMCAATRTTYPNNNNHHDDQHHDQHNVNDQRAGCAVPTRNVQLDRRQRAV